MAGLSDISLGNFTSVVYGAEGAYTQAALSELGGVQSVGEISDEATIVDVSQYGRKYLRKLVGSANASAIEVICNYDPSDAGQIDLQLAYNTSTKRSIGIIMNEVNSNDPMGDDGTHVVLNALIASASLSNSFDETRTITFSIVPIDGIADVNGSAGYKANPLPT